MAKSRLESWVFSDAFSARVEPLIPPRLAQRRFARKPIDYRLEEKEIGSGWLEIRCSASR
jgi:hypothetical protein